jgi:uncharacterized membrane protein
MESTDRNIQQQRYWPWWRIVMTGLNILALVISIILSWHYLKEGPMIGCSSGSPCEQVLNSRWSTIAGVLPISGLAMGVYLAMLVAGIYIGPSTDHQIRKLAWKFLLALAGAITGSAIWFIIVQKWFVGAFCPYCMTMHITGLLLSALIIRQVLRLKQNHSKEVPKQISEDKAYSFRVTDLVLTGLLLSGILTTAQLLIKPKAVYDAGHSQDQLTQIDYNAVPIIGSPNAPHVVKLLFDYQCSHCQKIHFMLDEVVRRYAGKLSFVLCPAPLSTECNMYIPQEVDAFKNSCELARAGLAVWAANREAYTAFENWMFTFESGDKWQPRSIEAARAKAMELVGEKFNDSIKSEWVEHYLQTCVQIYGQTVQGGKGGIPKLVYGSRWAIPEPNSTDDLIMILQKSLALPAP